MIGGPSLMKMTVFRPSRKPPSRTQIDWSAEYVTCARSRSGSPLFNWASSAAFFIGKISNIRPSKFRTMSSRSACERVNSRWLASVSGSAMATRSVGCNRLTNVVSSRRSGTVIAGSLSMW
jgi:hypothetical protein